MGLLTALSCRVLQVLSVRPSVVWMIELSTPRYRPRTKSMDGFTVVYRQVPRTTSPSSKEDLVNWYFILSLRKVSFANDSCNYPLLVVDDPYGRTGDRHKFSILSYIYIYIYSGTHSHTKEKSRIFGLVLFSSGKTPRECTRNLDWKK